MPIDKTLVLQFIISFIQIFAQLLTWVIFISVMLSWFSRGRRTNLGSYVDLIMRTICRPFRWARIGMLDLSPIAALLVLSYGAEYLIKLLQHLAT